ncbi:MAG: hypothetical protein QW580_07125 [Nitrososphaerota archaeon]
MMRWIDAETGLPLEVAEKIKPRIIKLEADISSIKPLVEALEQKTGIIQPSDSGVNVGTPENPAANVVAENVTVVSAEERKISIREPGEEELDLPLPRPKAYMFKGRGEEFIGFIVNELPPRLQRPGGYSLNELVAVLAYKVAKLERRLAELEKKPK